MQRNKLWFVALVTLFGASARAQNTFPASGNVGIGTITPSEVLEVNGNAKATRFRSTRYLNLTDVETSEIQIGNVAEAPVSILTNNLPRIYIQSNGDIGFGTTAPTAKLELIIASGATPFKSTAGSGGNWQFGQNAGGFTSDDTFSFYSSTFGPNHNYFPIFQMNSANGNLLLGPSGVGNVGIGTTSPSASLEVNGNVKLTQGSGASIKFQDGSVQSTAYTGNCSASGGDYAESVDVIGTKLDYEPGDVMVIDSSSPDHFRKASKPYAKQVAGIYSTKPGYVGRRQKIPINQASSEIPMAMIGIVPTKVTAENGEIEPGDLLVSSATPGYAMKGTDPTRMMGSVLGKAMGSLKTGKGVIEVLVTLQ